VTLLNRAVAVERAHGPARALSEIAPLKEAPKMHGYYLYLAVLGHLLLKLGRCEEAAGCFLKALACPCSEPERRFLRRKLAECAGPANGWQESDHQERNGDTMNRRLRKAVGTP
jgi:predicted RNA polymerase sigma factor